MIRVEIPMKLSNVRQEEWRDIKKYKGLYQVSNLGNVRSLDKVIIQKNKFGKIQKHIYKGKQLKKQLQKGGYEYVNLYKNNKMTKELVHRLVAITFLENKNGNYYINHKDNNKTNNAIDNLEWCTQSYNIKYAYDCGNKIAPHMKKIHKLDMDGKILNTFESIQQAERKTSIKSSNISKCCRNLRNKAGGFKWKYAD